MPRGGARIGRTFNGWHALAIALEPGNIFCQFAASAMSNFVFPRPTALAHAWLRALLCPGDHAVDATLGNGHDALFLAQCVGPEEGDRV